MKVEFLEDPAAILDSIGIREATNIAEAAYAKLLPDDQAAFDSVWAIIQDSRWMMELAWRLLEFTPEELMAFAELAQRPGYLAAVQDEVRYGDVE